MLSFFALLISCRIEFQNSPTPFRPEYLVLAETGLWALLHTLHLGLFGSSWFASSTNFFILSFEDGEQVSVHTLHATLLTDSLFSIQNGLQSTLSTCHLPRSLLLP